MNTGKLLDPWLIEPYMEMLIKMYTIKEAHEWLRSENKLLDGERAIDLIKRGEGDKVKNVIQCMLDVVYL